MSKRCIRAAQPAREQQWMRFRFRFRFGLRRFSGGRKLDRACGKSHAAFGGIVWASKRVRASTFGRRPDRLLCIPPAVWPAAPSQDQLTSSPVVANCGQTNLGQFAGESHFRFGCSTRPHRVEQRCSGDIDWRAPTRQVANKTRRTHIDEDEHEDESHRKPTTRSTGVQT